MHELSIALSILDLVALEAIKQKAHEVKEIELEVGHWAGVDISALSFSMRAAQRYSPFEKARVTIVEVPPVSHCTHQFCGCPHCHSADTELLQGRELRLKSILVE